MQIFLDILRVIIRNRIGIYYRMQRKHALLDIQVFLAPFVIYMGEKQQQKQKTLFPLLHSSSNSVLKEYNQRINSSTLRSCESSLMAQSSFFISIKTRGPRRNLGSKPFPSLPQPALRCKIENSLQL